MDNCDHHYIDEYQKCSICRWELEDPIEMREIWENPLLSEQEKREMSVNLLIQKFGNKNQ